jgi:uncharacterized CHY-type Zn-finger protein
VHRNAEDGADADDATDGEDRFEFEDAIDAEGETDGVPGHGHGGGRTGVDPAVDADGSGEDPAVDADGSGEDPAVDADGSGEDPPVAADGAGEDRETTGAPGAARPRGATGVRRRSVGDVVVHGVGVDPETRCVHYGTERDVIAIEFYCCREFYPCHACHHESAGHEPRVWPRSRFDAAAVLCGACGNTVSIRSYLEADDACPACGHDLNPGCVAHADRYFDVTGA